MRKNNLATFVLATSSVFLTSCDLRPEQRWEVKQQGNSTGSQGSSNSVKEKYTPVYVRLADGNLLRVNQIGGKIEFAKTAEGYGEYGLKGGIAGFSAGSDWSKGKVFIKIPATDALELVDGDWEKIAGPVYEQSRVIDNSVTQQVGIILYVLSTPPKGKKLFSPQVLLSDIEMPGSSMDADKEMSKNIVAATKDGKVITVSTKLSKYITLRLPDFNLLRVVQVGDELKFFVTSNGYGVSGKVVESPAASIGAEAATAMTYDEIPALAALALIQKDWRKLYDKAVAQAEIFEYTVDPNLVQKTLQPLIEGRYTGAPVIRQPATVQCDLSAHGPAMRDIICSSYTQIFPDKYFPDKEARIALIADSMDVPIDTARQEIVKRERANFLGAVLQNERRQNQK